MSTLSLLPVHWPAPRPVRAACTLRDGGVSADPYASFNLAAHVGDDPRAVASNRARLLTGLRLPHEPLWLNQVHGTQVLEASGALSPGAGPPPQADAATTGTPGIVLAVLVADCMPILLCRRDGAGVAVAHAGWRGLAAGVVEAAMAKLGVGAEQVLAWLGPSIGPSHFEVGDEVRAAFCAHDARAESGFTRNQRGRWQCDLYQIATQRLRSLGVGSIHGDRLCTYSERERFFSHRRDGRTGRMAALIWLEPNRFA
ncbi:MAG TPA: peptidoglycan editing factor PgeF [Steroidobacteraceae bacterium]|jgi:YfiH family protein|nr:peptidoglycan editing factor PgeF [Steroidobacteraceae bacterium]